MSPILLALVALTCAPPSARASIDVKLTPVADVWVYEHASDQDSYEYLYAWGSGTKSFEESYPPSSDYSYSYLSFDLSKLNAADVKLTEAKLVLTAVASEVRTAELMKKFPLEARAVSPKFDEKTWSYGGKNPAPGKALFGVGEPEGFKQDGEYKIVIDLLKEPKAFTESFASALAGDKKLGIALSTKMSPQDLENAYYKLYSKDGDKKLVPQLILKG